MSRSNDLLLYEDGPVSGGILRILPLIVLVLLAGAGLYLWSIGKGSGSLVLLAEGAGIGLVLWMIIPRKYQVYEDHLRIVMGGPFSIKIGFDQVTGIEITGRSSFTVNLVNRFARDYVRIAKRRGPGIAITPQNNELFVENARRALAQWMMSKLD